MDSHFSSLLLFLLEALKWAKKRWGFISSFPPMYILTFLSVTVKYKPCESKYYILCHSDSSDVLGQSRLILLQCFCWKIHHDTTVSKRIVNERDWHWMEILKQREREREKRKWNREKSEKLTYTWAGLSFLLRKKKAHTAGSLAEPAPPSPHLFCLLCYLNFTNVTRNGAGRKGRAKAMMHTTPTRHFLCRMQYSQYLVFTKSLRRASPSVSWLSEQFRLF